MAEPDKIKEYWDQRALQHSEDPAATTNDVYLRELEIRAIVDSIVIQGNSQPLTLLDVGCGDGYSTLAIGQRLSNVTIVGVDFSESMIANANHNLKAMPNMQDRVSFQVGDVTNLEECCGKDQYDIVLSDRCLINLDSLEHQGRAIYEIAQHVKDKGLYIAVENFIEGHDNMNNARSQLGLPEIPVRWHNRFFTEKGFLSLIGKYFTLLSLQDFASSYYFATRIVYSKMCQMKGVEPDYHHEIHQLAPQLTPVGQFSPIRMAILRKLAR